MQLIAEQLAATLGPKGWIVGEDTAPWHRDWLNRYGKAPLGVARPTSTEQVVAVVNACRAAGVPLAPQGGNTGCRFAFNSEIRRVG